MVFINQNALIVQANNNQTLEDLLNENEIFIVDKDYNLNGAVVSIPVNCIFKFNGGTISNGTLKGNNSIIIAPRYCIFRQIKLAGSFSIEEVYPEWWGGFPNRNIDCYEAIQSALDFASAHGGDEGKTVKLSVGRYGISHSLVLKQGCRLSGISPRSTWIYCFKDKLEGGWMIDTPYSNNMKPVCSSRIEDIQIRCTNSMNGEQFDYSCNGIRCRGWNETCGINNVQINGFDMYGLYLSSNERTLTQNSSFRDIFISNSGRSDAQSVGLFLDDVRQCVFESITIDNGPETKYGIGYGVYSIGHCDMNIFLKLNLEDCYHPIYIKDSIDECSFIALMINNPTHPMRYYMGSKKYKTAIKMDKPGRGFTINGYKRINNSGVDFDIVNTSKDQFIVFNPNISTGNSNIRWYVYESNIK